MELKRTPGLPDGDEWNPISEVTAITNTGDGRTIYTFTIDLSKASQEPWIPGENAYLLSYDMFKTQFVEGYESHLLSKMIKIKAPGVVLDIVTAHTALSESAWAINSFITYYKNDNEWTSSEVVEYQSSHSGIKAVKHVKLGDVNNMGRSDIIAVVDIGKDCDAIYHYSNDGKWTKRIVDDGCRGEIADIDLGNIDADSDLDIIVCYTRGEVGFYRNDGQWSYEKVGDYGDARITNPNRASGIVVRAIDLVNPQDTDSYPTSVDIVACYGVKNKDTGGIVVYHNTLGSGKSMTPIILSEGKVDLKQTDLYSLQPTKSENSQTTHYISNSYPGTPTTSSVGNMRPVF